MGEVDSIKMIAIGQLRPGMYVHDLNCGWLEHPFATNRFRVSDDEAVAKIVGLGIRELYIDTARGLNVADAPSATEVRLELAQVLSAVSESSGGSRVGVSVREERAQAEVLQREASQVVTDIMGKVRLGKPIEVERVQRVVSGMVGSIFRNQDALLSLGRIRRMDRYTFEHSVSVGALMIAFGKHLGFDVDTIREIGVGALLHDVGKLQVPEQILNKPGRLTEEEFAVMRRHVVFSRELLAATPGVPPMALALAAEHHERIDGSGYPNGLRADEISRYGQMAAIVDVYDAVSADRVYHKGLEPTETLRKLLEWSRHHFDPVLVQQFIRCVGIYPVGTLVRLESGRLALVVEPGEQGALYPVVRVVFDASARRYLTPHDLDLSNPGAAHGEDRIVNCESPERWGIKPQVFMEMAL